MSSNDDQANGHQANGRLPRKSPSTDLMPLVLENETLMWKDKKVSALVLVAFDFLFFVYFFFAPALIPFVFRTLLAFSLIGAGLKFAGVQVNKPLELFTESNVDKIAKAASSALSKGADFAVYVLSWKSHSDTVKVLVALYILGTTSGIFSFAFVAFVITNLLFVVPIQLRVQRKLIEVAVGVRGVVCTYLFSCVVEASHQP